jgi:uncharacterized protein (TIGR04206 family)
VTATDAESRWLDRRLMALALLAVVPWTVVDYGSGFNVVFLWVSVAQRPFSYLPVWEYVLQVDVPLRTLPWRLLGWPVATALFALAAVVEAIGRRVDRDWPLLGAGLLVLAAVVHLRTTRGFDRTSPEFAVPVGPLLVFVLVWWAYGDAIVDRLVGDDA